MNRRVYFFLAAFFCIAAIVVYKMYNKPHADLTETKADFSMTAAALLEEFETNEETAQSKYLNKIIAVNGTITEIQQVENKTIWILDTGNPLSTIQCEMDPRFLEKSKNAAVVGNAVTVQGLCSGKLMDIVMSQVVWKE
ncbi:MAG: hypothetical protein IPM92_10695 [Saprospiraceae bacterium]|nr:hypothetical protein [Saprospiraceae bacterium]